MAHSLQLSPPHKATAYLIEPYWASVSLPVEMEVTVTDPWGHNKEPGSCSSKHGAYSHKHLSKCYPIVPLRFIRHTVSFNPSKNATGQVFFLPILLLRNEAQKYSMSAGIIKEKRYCRQ